MGATPDNAHEPELPPVVEGRKRVFPFDTRCAVVRHYDSLPNDGSKGAYLRRSGLFKSSVNQWRVDMVNGVSEAKQRGRKAIDPTVREMARMKLRIEKLEGELARANAVIDVQKKSIGVARHTFGRQGASVMNAIAKDAVKELADVVDVRAGCEAAGIARSSFFYNAIPTDEQQQRGGGLQPNALSVNERTEVLGRLDSERFCDSSPRQVHAALLDDGVYLGSPRTFARVLASNDQSSPRQLQRTSVARVVPMLCAIVPNDIWSWDTSPLATTVKRVFLHLYVILDIYSRFAVAWSVESGESSLHAETLFERACDRDDVDANALIVHSDNGPIQRSNIIDDCFGEFGITKSYSRPHVSNDNPYSESLFKTAKYQPTYPTAFDDIDQARQWANETFTHYNYELYHSGIAMLTPASVHFGTHAEIVVNRQITLDAAYVEHPERFRNGKPTAKSPGPAWINKPSTTPDEKETRELN